MEEKVVYAPDKNFIYDRLTKVNTYISNGSVRSNATYNSDGTLIEYYEFAENGNYVKTVQTWVNATEETLYENGPRVLALTATLTARKQFIPISTTLNEPLPTTVPMAHSLYIILSMMRTGTS